MQMLNKIVEKFTKMLKNFNLDDAFMDWEELRNMMVYRPINWSETNIQPSVLDPSTNTMYVNTDIINYYDLSSNLMIYYLVVQLTKILESNNEKNTKTNISQMYIEIITYVYDLYNMERYKNSHELKRFMYILNGSDVMVDILRKGQGLRQSEELEENLNDVRSDIDTLAVETPIDESDVLGMESTNDEVDVLDIKAALDMESDYYVEEDEDMAQNDE